MAALQKTSALKFSKISVSLNKTLAFCGRIDLQAKARCIHATSSLQRKKSEWRMFRQPCNTELRHDKEEWVKERKAFGGRKKVKAIWKNKGTYALKSQDVELEVPILDVMHTDANKNHITKNILTKGSIVQIDATEFNNRLTGEKAASSVENTESSSKEQESTEASNTSSPLDQILSEMMKSKKLLAKITTRPGQDGLCDGYVLEGLELQTIMEKLSLKDANA